MLRQCWLHDAAARPSFGEVVSVMTSYFDTCPADVLQLPVATQQLHVAADAQ